MVRALCMTLAMWALAAGCAGGTPDPGPSDGPRPTPTPDGRMPAGDDGGAPPGADAAPPSDAQEPDQSPPVALGDRIASVVLTDEGGAGAGGFVTFAQPFRRGDVPAGATVIARTKDDAPVDLQVDTKARHADGSLRHAVLTARVPSLTGGRTELRLFAAAAAPTGRAPVTAAALLATSFDTTVSLALGGATYTASVRPLLAADASKTWLAGHLATEWTLAAPFTAAGAAHPHLSARFDVRAYAGLGTVVVSATIENDWAYEPGPQNFTYDVTVATDKGVAFTAPKLVHYSQARWRRTVVWGADAKIGVAHDVAYLMATDTVPRFDLDVVAAPAALAELDKQLSGAAVAPLGIGLAEPYMPETGGRGDIGPLPSWAALYLISQDARARRATFATGERAGSWSIHYRDRTTGRPVSLDDHPNMTLLGNPPDTCDAKTGKCDSFPTCGGDCKTPYTPDSAHQPSLAYLPYLLGGERYFLEELEFWANWNMLQANPAYRERARGLLHWDQPRGQAWSMRTLGELAYIAPDDDPMKAYFVARLANNLAWYNQQYPGNPKANALGYLDTGSWLGDDGTMAPWMDDFFTWSTGHLVALGFEDARPLRDWKVKYAIGRMMDPAYCWIFASVYHMAVEDPATKARYGSWAQVYGPTLADAKSTAAQPLACGGAEMAAALQLKPGEMVGYSAGPEGYPSNLQPALAAAAESGVAGGREAWAKFMGRSVKPDYTSEPQFAIVPR
jgi:hypothetical protein